MTTAHDSQMGAAYETYCARMAAQYRLIEQAHLQAAALAEDFAEQVDDDGRAGAACRR